MAERRLCLLLSAVCLPTTWGVHTTPSANCTLSMNTYCNGPMLADCIEKVKVKGGAAPLVALNDLADGGSETAWRCYSPTCLINNNTVYNHSSHCRLYCTTPALKDILENCTDPHTPPVGKEVRVNATDVWGSLATTCHEIRTPELVKTPTSMILIGQCRDARSPRVHNHELSDDMRNVKLIQTISTDNGSTWKDPRLISDIGRSVGVAIYDRLRDTVILQYSSFTSSNPYADNTLWQRVSTDRGATWGDERNISSYLEACNTGSGGIMCGAAGSRLQTVSGRIVFSGHNSAGVCVWWSDNGGQDYNVSQPTVFKGNEQSIADLGNGSLYMNGRGMQFPFAGKRASYWSHDDGTTWGPGSEAFNLEEPNSFGCDGALIAIPNTAASPILAPPRIFFSEPHGPVKRISYRIWCSLDGGVTWPRYIGVNLGDVAAYSALEYYVDEATHEPMLLAVWEQSPTMLSYRFTVNDWCPPVEY